MFRIYVCYVFAVYHNTFVSYETIDASRSYFSLRLIIHFSNVWRLTTFNSYFSLWRRIVKSFQHYIRNLHTVWLCSLASRWSLTVNVNWYNKHASFSSYCVSDSSFSSGGAFVPEQNIIYIFIYIASYII